jgi:hypothetical protein
LPGGVPVGSLAVTDVVFPHGAMPKFELTNLLDIFAEAHIEIDLLTSKVGIDDVNAFGKILAGDEGNANRRRLA